MKSRLLHLCLLGIVAASCLTTTATDSDTLQTLKAGWDGPARTYKPHTRWWWPGNALTKADITWQLEQMAAQGMGGVEIMNTWKMYDKGNVEYLTPEFLDLVKHAVSEGKRLNLDVAISFCPGWSFGGGWVPEEDQSKALSMGTQELSGGQHFDDTLPGIAGKGDGSHMIRVLSTRPGKLIAVVAGRITGNGQLDPDSLTVLTPCVKPGSSSMAWDVPPGKWRLMAFWLKYTGQTCQAQTFKPTPMVIDHLNKGAIQRYCDHLGGAFAASFGDEFGRTVDSFFSDSFEITSPPDSLLWSNDTLAGFEKHSGYDFTKYLPALWYDIGDTTPRVRYDLGKYLSDLGLDAFFKTFNDWCNAHNIQARIQPYYRFTEELVQGAGATARPEMEVTTARFESIPDPRKAVSSGAKFYGHDIVSAEAYTFIHPKRYRTDLQDIKIATDAFLRDGVTQFYNHGYFASPEMHVAPNRDMPWANRISHWNTWWKYYHCLASYVARCCYMLRQGHATADVLIYSPQATAWSERALWVNDRRVMQYGNLGKTLVANGYDFDIVNDDLLQHRADFGNGGLSINGYHYRLLILPRATVVPIETMRSIRDFAKAGGTVIALDELPSAAAGLTNLDANDRELKQIAADVFGLSPVDIPLAITPGVFLPNYKLNGPPFDPGRKPYSTTPPLTDPQRRLLAAIDRVTPPDFSLAGHAQSDGLTFIHKRIDDIDLYFVCNLEPTRIATDASFRVTGKTPQRWNAVTGETEPVTDFRAYSNSTTIPVDFAPWESAFFLFTHLPSSAKVAAPTTPLPAPMLISGQWKMKLEGYGFDTFETTIDSLASWTDSDRTRHFSGTGRYEIEFDLPPAQSGTDARMFLDLGQVGTVAEVQLNDQPVGIAWMTPYRLDITHAAHPGKNKLVILVTDTLINYVSGLKSPPDVPLDLQPRLGKANPAIYEYSNRVPEMHETDLPPSGLIGPVQIEWRY